MLFRCATLSLFPPRCHKARVMGSGGPKTHNEIRKELSRFTASGTRFNHQHLFTVREMTLNCRCCGEKMVSVWKWATIQQQMRTALVSDTFKIFSLLHILFSTQTATENLANSKSVKFPGTHQLQNVLQFYRQPCKKKKKTKRRHQCGQLFA